MANIIDGKGIAAQIRAELKRETADFLAAHGVQPCLAVVLVGDDPASQVYVRNKGRACEEIGFRSEQIVLPATVPQSELDAVIDRLNADPTVHGILVQLPLPAGLDERRVLLRIDPCKDVDAFHPYNIGLLSLGQAKILPCTPAGVMELLRRSQIEIVGRECVVVGRSDIVGKPMAQLLLGANGTVTVCHSRTRNLAEVTRRADILVAAIGRADFFTAEMVKPGAVVIDVGINRGADGKLHGDVNFSSVEPVASYITPVPGGVGPMTIAMLMRNTLRAAEEQICSR